MFFFCSLNCSDEKTVIVFSPLKINRPNHKKMTSFVIFEQVQLVRFDSRSTLLIEFLILNNFDVWQNLRF